MAIHLDHFIVPCRDQIASANRLAELPGVKWAEQGAGPFSPVYVNDGLSLDFIDDEPSPSPYCFRVSEGDFAHSRAHQGGRIPYLSTPHGRQTCNQTIMAAGWSTGTSRRHAWKS